jgi:plastocyanin
VPTYEGPVTATFTATDLEPDPSGVDFTEYRIDPTDDGADVFANGLVWNPDQAEIAVGEEVTWHFDEPAAQFSHNVYLVPPGGDPDLDGDDIFQVTSGNIPSGGPPASYTFEEEGEWTYICTLHATFSGGAWSGMVGTAEVSNDWTTYDPLSPPTVSDPGTHTIDYRSVDLAGNVEETQSVEFEIGSGGAGSPALNTSVKPKKKVVGPNKKKVRFRARVANVGDGDAGKLRLCAGGPKRKVKVIGNKCQSVSGLAGSKSVVKTFKVKPKRALRGKKARIKFSANGVGVSKARAVAVLKVRR